MELPLEQFYRRKYKSGRVSYRAKCKSCVNAASNEWKRNNPAKARAARDKWRNDNPEKYREAQDRWRNNNLDKVRENVDRWRENNKERCKTTSARWAEHNKDRRAVVNAVWRRRCIKRVRTVKAAYIKKRRISDPYFRMTENIKAAMSVALRGNKKSAHTEELLGCSIE